MKSHIQTRNNAQAETHDRSKTTTKLPTKNTKSAEAAVER